MAAVDVGVLFVKNIQVVCLSVQVAVVEIRSERKGKIGVVAQTLTLMVRSSFSGTFPRTIEALRSPPRRLCPTSSYVHSCRIAAKICLDNHLHIIHPPLPNDCVHMERRGALCVVSQVRPTRASKSGGTVHTQCTGGGVATPGCESRADICNGHPFPPPGSSFKLGGVGKGGGRERDDKKSASVCCARKR